MLAYIIVAALTILLVVREYLSFRERADMLDRLMSRSLPEYKDNLKPEENHLEIKDDGMVDIENVNDSVLDEDGKERPE